MSRRNILSGEEPIGQAVVRLCLLGDLSADARKARPPGMASLAQSRLLCSDASGCPCQVGVQEFREPPSETKEKNPTPTARQLAARRQVGVYSICGPYGTRSTSSRRKKKIIKLALKLGGIRPQSTRPYLNFLGERGHHIAGSGDPAGLRLALLCLPAVVGGCSSHDRWKRQADAVESAAIRRP